MTSKRGGERSGGWVAAYLGNFGLFIPCLTTYNALVLCSHAPS